MRRILPEHFAARPFSPAFARLDHSELPDVLPAAEAMAVPSTFPEAFGMVAAEAAACGALPVVAAHSGLAEVARTLGAAHHARGRLWHQMRQVFERYRAEGYDYVLWFNSFYYDQYLEFSTHRDLDVAVRTAHEHTATRRAVHE